MNCDWCHAKPGTKPRRWLLLCPACWQSYQDAADAVNLDGREVQVKEATQEAHDACGIEGKGSA